MIFVRGDRHRSEGISAPDALWNAEAYDAWFAHSPGADIFAVESSALLREVSPAGGQTILDAGCGTGRLMAAISATGAAVVGVDPDRGMARIADRLGNGMVARSRAEALPFPDGRFDATVAMTVLEFVDDFRIVLQEMARVTRTGGRIVIGALNPISPWGLGLLRQRHQVPWIAARFPPRRSLAAELSLYGPTRVTGVALGGIANARPALLGRYCGFQVIACLKQ